MKFKLLKTHFLQRKLLLLLMKTYLLFFCMTVFGFTGKTSFSQEKIIVPQTQMASIDDVFQMIRSQTNYRFIYSKNLFKNTPEIQLVKGELNIESILKRFTELAKVEFQVKKDNTIIINKKIQDPKTGLNIVAGQQKKPVKGVVYTAIDKVTLPGATILEKGTNNGVTSNFDGEFSIDVTNSEAILVISYVGYATQEIPVKGISEVEIYLEEDLASLDEVVVVGFGPQKKISLTGAVSTVDVDDMKQNPTASISNALAGNVPGIMAMMQSGQPGLNISEFWIRGISTFGGGTNPLVLVDNIERDLNDLNIEDIKSISVLKDAAETAMYGSRGANGVILITTKRGKSGKIKINFKDEVIYNTRTITPEFEDGVTYASLLNESRITRNESPIYQPEELEIIRLGLDPDLYPNVDWKELLLRDGAMTYRANLNMSGGGPTSRYFISGSYINEGGMYEIDQSLKDDYNTNANYRRWNYRLNADFDISATTIAKVGVAGILAKRNSPGLGDGDFWGSLFGYSPIRTPILYSNGYVPAIGSGNRTNPYVMATQSGFNENWTNNVQTNVTIEQDFGWITPGLRMRGIVGYDIQNVNTIERRKWPEQWRADRARDANGDLVFSQISGPQELTQNSFSSGNRLEFYDLMTSYDKSIGEHNLGGAVRFTRDAFIQTVALGGDIKNGISRRNQALAGRVYYNYKSKYFMNFNFGYTGSENFAPGRQYGFFPAISGAYNIAGEKFIQDNLEWLRLLKVRFSYGKVGNDRLAGGERFPYLYTISQIFNDDGDPAGGYQWADFGSTRYFGGMRYSQVASSNVTWEVATKQNLGFDIETKSITANMDFFKEDRSGIYMARNFLPAMVGLESTPRANVGIVKSQGFDGRFQYRKQIGEFNITARSNITYSKNEIIERDEENNVYPYQNQEGFRVDQSKGLIALGLFEDYDDIRNSPAQQFGVYQPGDIKYKDVNGDGVINDGDRVAIGATRRPNLIYGIGGNVNWRSFSFGVLFQGAGKSTFSTYGKTVHAFSEGEWGQLMKGIMGDNRWIDSDISGDPSTEDPNASYPRLSFGPNPNNFRESTFWLRDGRYLRLKNIELGYNLPTKLINKVGLENVRLYVVGTNLVTWSKFDLWDPELATPRGEDYPPAKSYLFGININL